MKKILLSAFLVLMVCTQSLAESSVWKIQKGDAEIFLGGTFHILRQSDFPLPEEFEKAYSSSDILVFETDLGKLKDASTQQRLISKAMYADGSTADKHLSAETYRLLKQYCESNSIPLSQLMQFKPSVIAITMAVVELAKLGAAQDGVDMFYYQSATTDKKPIEGLETVDEQIDFIVGMGEGNEDKLITYTINDLVSIKENYETMTDAWRKGNVQGLYNLILREIKTKMPGLYKDLITDRNEKWLSRIDAYLETPEREFILVGVGHLVGPEGIIEALRQKGCKVEKM